MNPWRPDDLADDLSPDEFWPEQAPLSGEAFGADGTFHGRPWPFRALGPGTELFINDAARMQNLLDSVGLTREIPEPER